MEATFKSGYPRLCLPDGFGERDREEMVVKGYFRVSVALCPATRYSLYFSDPIRIRQDLEAGLAWGRNCLAETGLVVIPEVTLERIEAVVHELIETHFFDSLRPEPPEGVGLAEDASPPLS